MLFYKALFKQWTDDFIKLTDHFIHGFLMHVPSRASFLIKGRFPLGGIFRARGIFLCLVISRVELY
jgi:hypothetical protein